MSADAAGSAPRRVQDAIGRLWDQMRDPSTPDLIHAYFAEPDDATQAITGRWLGRLGEISDEHPDPEPNAFTPTDLVAAGLVGRPIPPAAALALLGVGVGARRDWQALLTALPADVHITKPEAQAQLKGRTLSGEPRPEGRALFEAVLGLDGMDRELASAVVHRKRPKLFPLWDAAVELSIAPGDAWWEVIATVFEDPAALPEMVALRERALEDTGVHPGEVSLVRMIHAVLFLRHRRPVQAIVG